MLIYGGKKSFLTFRRGERLLLKSENRKYFPIEIGKKYKDVRKTIKIKIFSTHLFYKISNKKLFPNVY